jgi:hypothetical protein
VFCESECKGLLPPGPAEGGGALGLSPAASAGPAAGAGPRVLGPGPYAGPGVSSAQGVLEKIRAPRIG